MTKHKIQNKYKAQISNNKIKVLILVIVILNLFCHFPDLSGSRLCREDFAIWNSLIFAQESSKEEEAIFVAKKAFEDGFYEVSLGLLERFLVNYPGSKNSQEANLLIGRCFYHQNRFLDALNKFEELLNKTSAKDIKDAVLYWIAEVHFKGNDFIKAGQYYKMVIDEFPKSSYAVASLYSLGWCLFQEAKYAEALDYFRMTKEKFPAEPQAQDSYFKIIECLYNLKDYAGLKESARPYLKAYPKDTSRIPYLYFYLAESDYYLNNFTEAINEYTKVISNTGDDRIKALSLLGMAWSYLKLKQYQQAQDIFLEIKPDSLERNGKGILLLGKAILFQETNRFSEAKNIYDELLNNTSEPIVSMQAYLGKADAFYNMAEYQEAIGVYKQTQDKVATREGVPQEMLDKLYYGLAWSYLKEGRFKEAIDEFQKIAKHSEDKIVKISALCQIGDTYQDSGDYNNAALTYDTILKDYPDSFYSDYIQYQLGLTLLKASNYDGAIMSFLNLKKNFPNSKLLDDAAYSLGLAYFQRQDYASSKEIFEEFISVYKDSNLRAQGTYLLGTSLYNLGRFLEAIEVFKTIIKTYNQDKELMQKAEYEIADCFYQLGDEKEAMVRFKMLRAKYPDSDLTPEVMWWLGEYHYRRNELDLARRYFSSLIRDFPKSNLVADSYYALGSTYQQESKYLEAIDNFKKVIELGKSDLAGQAAIAIADIYLKQERFDLALTTHKNVTNQYPNLVHLIYPKLADIYFKMGDYAGALDFYRKSQEVVPVQGMSYIQFKIAETLQAQGKFQEAAEEYLKVTYLYAQDNNLAVRALLRVAAIYEDKEKFAEALNIYKRITSMEVEEAKYARERMDWINKHIK